VEFNVNQEDLKQTVALSAKGNEHGVYTIQQVRDGKVIWEEDITNLLVNQGLDYMLNSSIANGAAAITAWFIGLYSGNVAPAASWTAANVTANSTEFTNYTQSTRVAYTPGASSGQSVSSGVNTSSFTINTGGGTLWGVFLASASAKSATSGTLLAASQLGASRTLLAADVINIGYAVSLTSS
jgi:hypothetical protein